MSDNTKIQKFHTFAGHPGKFWPAFLAFACRQAGAKLCALFNKKSGAWKPLYQWSTNGRRCSFPRPLPAKLSALAEKCLQEGSAATPINASSERIALGLALDKKAGGQSSVVIFFLKATTSVNLDEISRRLNLIADAPAIYYRQRSARQAQKDLDFFAGVLDQMLLLNAENRFLAAAMSLVNETAARYQCARVSLGWCDNGYVRLQAVSHMERFDSKMNMVTSLEAAMEEALDQDEEILLPAAEITGAIAREHEKYAKQQQVERLISLPLRANDQPVGVLTCESEGAPFTEDNVRSLRILGDQVSCRLAELKQRDRWFGAKLKDGFFKRVSGLLGVEHTLAKLVGVLTCALLFVSIIVKLPYRVEAAFILRSEDVRQVAAPFDGYIDTVQVKIGQQIEQGDRLLLLDTRDLLLEESAALANQIRFLREGEKARAQNTLIEMKIAQARADQAKAQLDLIRHRLGKAQVSSPIKGIIVEGDLEELQGAPVSKGDILFKVARHENLFVELKIEEDDIHEISEGQTGKVAFVSQPQLKYPIKIFQIDSVALPGEAGNIFVARGKNLEASMDWWRPGMSGIAKLDVGRRRIIWIITHRTIDFFQMLMWW
ncbi:MAG: HlyD family efflux transporter periplasmic adaptor subunit [Deltaproteobacteria bacterium]|nr:HlyD family efflux transporter periplasmic adaptor subunit [Deltaproteobacteria bacterium]